MCVVRVCKTCKFALYQGPGAGTYKDLVSDLNALNPISMDLDLGPNFFRIQIYISYIHAFSKL